MKKCIKCGTTKETAERKFFQLPEKESRAAWLSALGLSATAEITEDDVICTDHFKICEGTESKAKENPVESNSTTEVNKEADKSPVDDDDDDDDEPLRDTVSKKTIPKGIAVFSCTLCPAMFLIRKHFERHMAGKGQSWNVKTHEAHYRLMKKAKDSAEVETVVENKYDHTYAQEARVLFPGKTGLFQLGESERPKRPKLPSKISRRNLYKKKVALDKIISGVKKVNQKRDTTGLFPRLAKMAVSKGGRIIRESASLR